MLNIVIEIDTWQGIEMKTAIGEFLQRNFKVATHFGFDSSFIAYKSYVVIVLPL